MNILVTRFSSLGDVALTLPVIRAFQQQYPDHQLFFLSNQFFKDLFAIEKKVTFISADLKKEHDGVQGLHRLYRFIKKEHHIDLVIDLHNSLRSNFINAFFKTRGISVHRMNKGREEKKELTQKENKKFVPLKHTTQRYADVFGKAGFDLTLNQELKKHNYPGVTPVDSKLGDKSGNWIGVAPFAKHKGKQLSLDKMREVLEKLNQLPNITIYLFGNGEAEALMTNQLITGLGNTKSLINQLAMQNELYIMGKMDVMLTMDSANMHLASAVGTPVVSIWGATHHYAGFLGFGQQEEDIVADFIECRPCSVYGNKECWRGDYACLKNLTVQSIVEKTQQFLT